MKGIGQELGTKEIKVVPNWKDLGFGVEVGNVGHEVGTCD